MMMLPVCHLFSLPHPPFFVLSPHLLYRCFNAKMGLEGSWSPPKLCSPEAAAVWGISDGTLSALCTVWNIYSILCCSSLC